METFDTPKITIKKVPVGNFGNNVYVLVCKATGDSVIVDTSFEARQILEATEGTTVRYILQTHCHSDHIQALAEVKRRTGAPVGIHPDDADHFGIEADFDLHDEDIINFGECQVKVVFTPGHSPGGVGFLFPGHFIIGDTVFPGGPGMTSSPQEFEQLSDSIQQKVYSLPDETALYPGHGENTTVGESKKEYTVFASKVRDRPVCGDVLWLET